MKRVLFVIESLGCGGAEKSLVNLLNIFDYSKYEVDLQMFSYGGEFETMLPPEVNLLPPLKYFEFCSGNTEGLQLREKAKMLQGRLSYSCAIRAGKFNHPQKAVLF